MGQKANDPLAPGEQPDAASAEPAQADDDELPRTIQLCGEITWESVQRFAERLDELNRMSGGSVILCQIISPGGNAMCGMAIHDMIATNPVPVITIAYGLAGSAACIAFQGGLKRIMAPNARLMIHQAGVDVEATVNADMAKTLGVNLRDADRKIARLFAKRSGQPLASILKMKAVETVLYPRQAVESGFADGLLAVAHRPDPPETSKPKKKRRKPGKAAGKKTRKRPARKRAK